MADTTTTVRLCRNKHQITPDNSITDRRGQRFCKICWDARTAERQAHRSQEFALLAAKKAAKWGGDVCPNGHDLAENMATSRGRAYCRKCKADREVTGRALRNAGVLRLLADVPTVADVDPNWRRHAACRDSDPEAFFADNEQDIADAKGTCWRRCPVQADCLRSVLGKRDTQGVWGGLDEYERDIVRGMDRKVRAA